MGAHLRVLTNSQMKCFRRCAREHYLSYLLGYRSVNEADALRFGTIIHLGLAAWWLATEEPLAAAIEAMRPRVEDDYELVRLGVLLQGYDARWGDARDEYEVLGIEHEFYAPLINPQTGAASRTFEVGGKMDVIVRKRVDLLVYVVEHKSTGEDIGAGSYYWQHLQIDSQVSIYVGGGKSIGHDVAGCLYDVLGKPNLRPLKATPEESRKYTKQGHLYANQRAEDETPDEYRQRLIDHIAENPDRYYQRGDVVRLETEERDAAFDTWQTARMIREAELANSHPRNPESCGRYGRVCDFFGVCTGSASLDDTNLFRKVEHVHQELSGERAA